MIQTLGSIASVGAVAMLQRVVPSSIPASDAASHAFPLDSPSLVSCKDRTGEVLNRLEGLPRDRRGPLAERFYDLVRESHADEKPFYAAATYHLDRLLKLEPWWDGENTEFEYLAFQLLETILNDRDLPGFVYYLGIMGGERGLQALEGLALKDGRSEDFKLSDVMPASDSRWPEFSEAVTMVRSHRVFEPVRDEILRFLSTAAQKRDGVISVAGARGDSYFAGASSLVEAFGYGLENPDLKRRVRDSIRVAARHPLAFLKMNRLAHVLMSRESEDKLSEFVPETQTLLGKLFSRLERLPALLAEVDAAVAVTHPADRPSGNTLRGLLLAHPTGHSSLLAQALDGDVDFETHPKGVFVRLASESKRRFADDVEAFYRTPASNGGRAAIVVREMSTYEAAVRGVHEFVHLEQEKHHGPGWIERHLVAAEMEAFAAETLFRLKNGDRRLYDVIASLSPQGFASGLRIAVEQIYLRNRDLPVG